MGHISDHLRPNLTNVNATYAGPKPDDRYVLKTTAGSGSQAQGAPAAKFPLMAKVCPRIASALSSSRWMAFAMSLTTAGRHGRRPKPEPE